MLTSPAVFLSKLVAGRLPTPGSVATLTTVRPTSSCRLLPTSPRFNRCLSTSPLLFPTRPATWCGPLRILPFATPRLCWSLSCRPTSSPCLCVLGLLISSMLLLVPLLPSVRRTSGTPATTALVLSSLRSCTMVLPGSWRASCPLTPSPARSATRIYRLVPTTSRLAPTATPPTRLSSSSSRSSSVFRPTLLRLRLSTGSLSAS